MLTVGSLCAGYGGLELALQAAGWPVRTAWHAELDPDASTVLAHRWPGTPNHDDITRTDWRDVEPVDVLTAGFPCQDISNAGKRAGIEGSRSGIWSNVADAVRVLRPRIVLLENVSALLGRGLGRVVGDLAAIGYVGSWLCLRASDVGACHRRDRVFILAHPADTPHLRLPGIGQPRHGRPGPADGRGGPGGLSLLPTPAARLGDGRGSPDADLAARRMGEQGRRNLDDAVALLPTPAARDADRGAGWGDQPGRPLSETIHRLLPTPRASDGAKGGPNQRGSSGDLALPAAVQPGRWGRYGPAIARWETVLGRPAPDPTEPGRTGKPRLAPRFVEWMQGLDDGWVTAVPGLSRSAKIRLLGNGVVPLQAAYAYAALSTTIGSEASA